jgi:hypothetical protein
MALEKADIERLFKELRKNLSVEELKTFEAELDAVNDKLTSGTASVTELAEAFEKLTKSIKNNREEQAAAKKATESFDAALQNSIKTLTGVEDASNTLIGSFINLASEEEGAEKVTEQFKETLEKTFTTINIGTSITRKFAEATFAMAKEIDAGTASFNQATGAGGLYNRQIQAAERANRQFGLSIQDITEARIGLADGLSGFAMLQEQEQDRLIELTARFKRLGVSTADFIGIIQTGTRVLGLNTQQITKAAEEIRKFGQAIGVSTGQIMSEFNAALPALASFGAEATEIFKGLQLISQQTGLATGELTSFADQFMSIENTARAVAGVQAILGPIGIDQLTLLQKANEGQDAVIEYFRGALLQRGGYESLSRLQKAALANQLNIDEATLSGLMNTEKGIEERNELQTDFNEALQAGIGLTEQLTIFAKNFAITVTPVVEGLTSVFQSLNAALAHTGDLMKVVFSSAALAGTVGGIGKLANAMFGVTRVGALAVGAGAFGLGAAGILGLGGLAYGGLKLAGAFEDGTDNYPGGPILDLSVMGENGKPEVTVPPPGSAIINNENIERAARIGAAGGGGETVVTAAAPTVEVYIGKDQIKGFVTKIQNENLGRAPNLRPVVGV